MKRLFKNLERGLQAINYKGLVLGEEYTFIRNIDILENSSCLLFPSLVLLCTLPFPSFSSPFFLLLCFPSFHFASFCLFSFFLLFLAKKIFKVHTYINSIYQYQYPDFDDGIMLMYDVNIGECRMIGRKELYYFCN